MPPRPHPPCHYTIRKKRNGPEPLRYEGQPEYTDNPTTITQRTKETRRIARAKAGLTRMRSSSNNNSCKHHTSGAFSLQQPLARPRNIQ